MSGWMKREKMCSSFQGLMPFVFDKTMFVCSFLLEHFLHILAPRSSNVLVCSVQLLICTALLGLPRKSY